MRIVRPFRSFSVARGCARVDSTLDTAKLCSDRRIDVDRPWLRAVLGEEKRFYTALYEDFRVKCYCNSMSFIVRGSV
jgi:hypothetical protein